jgi:hypothetical protein
VRLRDDTFPILTRPTQISRDPHGRLIVADRSDKDIKVYGVAGERLATVGGAGLDPGRFAYLNAAQSYGDSLVAYDFPSERVTVFEKGGRVVRTFQPRFVPYTLRTVDDSLLLLIRHPGQGGNLLALMRSDGTVLAKFFDPRGVLPTQRLRFLSGVLADARDGYVFAAVFGTDSLWVFDYAGRRIATVAIPARPWLPRLSELLRRNGGRERNADSSWFHQGVRAVMGLVALDRGSVAIQIAAYDTHEGTDLKRGEHEVVLVHTDPSRESATRSISTEGAMLGRDIDGALLFVSYQDLGARTLRVHRVRAP